MGDRENNWVPIVAGVVVGAGILTLLYKMFFSQKTEQPQPVMVKIMRPNQQMNAPYKCTCELGGSDHVSSRKMKDSYDNIGGCRYLHLKRLYYFDYKSSKLYRDRPTIEIMYQQFAVTIKNCTYT